MNQTFTFRLVSPEAEVMHAPAVQVTVPGTEGDFGVRAGHMPLISTLRPGVVTFEGQTRETSAQFFIAGGFANVNANECSVMAESAVDVLSLNADVAAADVASLEARLKTANDDVTVAQLRGELDIAKARLIAARAA